MLALEKLDFGSLMHELVFDGVRSKCETEPKSYPGQKQIDLLGLRIASIGTSL